MWAASHPNSHSLYKGMFILMELLKKCTLRHSPHSTPVDQSSSHPSQTVNPSAAYSSCCFDTMALRPTSSWSSCRLTLFLNCFTRSTATSVLSPPSFWYVFNNFQNFPALSSHFLYPIYSYFSLMANGAFRMLLLSGIPPGPYPRHFAKIHLDHPLCAFSFFATCTPSTVLFWANKVLCPGMQSSMFRDMHFSEMHFAENDWLRSTKDTILTHFPTTSELLSSNKSHPAFDSFSFSELTIISSVD